MFVQNNAGSLLAQGGFEAARYKMAEGQAYAGMLQGMGSMFSSAIQEQQFKKQKKERDAAAAQTLGKMFGMEEKDALAVTQSVGAENIANFAMAQERMKQSQMEAEQLQVKAQADASTVSYLERAIRDPNANQAVRSLAELSQNGIPVSPEQLKAAVMMRPEQPWQPSVVELGGGERALMTSPSSAQRITPEKAAKPEGVSLTDVVSVKLPADMSNPNAMFDERNAVKMTAKQAVELGVPEYVQVYLPKYFEEEVGEKVQNEVRSIVETVKRGTLAPAEGRKLVEQRFKGREWMAEKYLEWLGY